MFLGQYKIKIRSKTDCKRLIGVIENASLKKVQSNFSNDQFRRHIHYILSNDSRYQHSGFVNFSGWTSL